MPKRSEKRDAARAAYVEKKSRGGKVNLRELAEELGVSYQTVRNWKAADGWDQALPPKNGAASRGTGTAPDTKTPPGATKEPRRATGTRRRTELIAPSFLICSPRRSGRSYMAPRCRGGRPWSMR